MLKINKPIRVNPTFMRMVRLFGHGVLLIWLTVVFYQGFTDQLGGDPVQSLINFTGIGALNLLIISLTISPLALHLKFAQLIPFRRPIGLYSALYALSHFYVFIAFELQFELRLIVSEIIERPYITVGFITLLILIALSVTSLNVIKKRMGAKWFTLHSLTYVAVILAGLHYLWLVKLAWYEPAIYLLFSIYLLTLRRTKIKKIFK
ncbi:MAG: sulfoxide reductase heme-binding subunit YedZ [Congregibacter sp.]|jgi:sulfoxide reductase heme-binding subunit YedZ